MRRSASVVETGARLDGRRAWPQVGYPTADPSTQDGGGHQGMAVEDGARKIRHDTGRGGRCETTRGQGRSKSTARPSQTHTAAIRPACASFRTGARTSAHCAVARRVEISRSRRACARHGWRVRTHEETKPTPREHDHRRTDGAHELLHHADELKGHRATARMRRAQGAT